MPCGWAEMHVNWRCTLIVPLTCRSSFTWGTAMRGRYRAENFWRQQTTGSLAFLFLLRSCCSGLIYMFFLTSFSFSHFCLSNIDPDTGKLTAIFNTFLNFYCCISASLLHWGKIIRKLLTGHGPFNSSDMKIKASVYCACWQKEK